MAGDNLDNMLTRLKVSGFKNLVAVDVRFGAFTCIAGANGMGKSNLFDAIAFLGALATKPLTQAALAVRDEAGRGSDVRSLFHRVGEKSTGEMSFEAEMLVPPTSVDEYGQTAVSSRTFLRYRLKIGLRAESSTWATLGGLEILEEELVGIPNRDATSHLRFPHKVVWREAVSLGVKRTPFISTNQDEGSRRVHLHQDGGSSGKPLSKPATNLPRTVLSTANAAENPTVLCAKREMESWILLQLEPSALRAADDIHAATHLGAHGEHLPATLYRLAGHATGNGNSAQIYSRITNRLSGLIEDIHGVGVDRDDKRETLTLQVRSKNGTNYPARSLSDGTLRFLALAVLEEDASSRGVICLEEPENGIHPDRVPTMLRLLRDIATDADEVVDETNPLRQVIVNTHSPAVVMQVPLASLLIAEAVESADGRGVFQKTVFTALSNTWRTKHDPTEHSLAPGKLLSYVNPVKHTPDFGADEKRVFESQEAQMLDNRKRKAQGAHDDLCAKRLSH